MFADGDALVAVLICRISSRSAAFPLVLAISFETTECLLELSMSFLGLTEGFESLVAACWANFHVFMLEIWRRRERRATVGAIARTESKHIQEVVALFRAHGVGLDFCLRGLPTLVYLRMGGGHKPSAFIPKNVTTLMKSHPLDR